MKIIIERSGGFAGITKKVTVDTDQLPKRMAQKIENQLSKPKIALGSATMKNKTADCYHYRISCRAGNRKREFEFSEFDVNQEFRSTINLILSKIKI